MECCAVICEYNPLHNGHAYQLNKMRELTNCEGVICIMSGDFVQRGEPAMIDKLSRTHCALASGADLVTELPTPFAIGNAETFARGAVQIADRLPEVCYLAMGCETDAPENLFPLADIQLEESAEFKRILDSELSHGNSYPFAYTQATAICGEKVGIGSAMSRIILSKPNNILCIEYIKALKRINSNIKPLPIQRIAEPNSYATASEIREMLLKSNNYEQAARFLPDYSFKLLCNNKGKRPDSKTYSDILLYKLRNMSVSDLESFEDVGEGLAYSFLRYAKTETELSSLLEKIKSKRYTMSRLKRICLHVMLDLKKDVMSDITSIYSNILGIKQEYKSYLSKLPDEFYIKLPDTSNIDRSKQIILNTQKAATTLYSLLTHSSDYSYPPKLITGLITSA